MNSVTNSTEETEHIVILRAWSSGTSALTGVFERLGFYSCPPHFKTNDPRTPNSYESLSLRDVILPHFDEPSLTNASADFEKIVDRLKSWSTEAAKASQQQGSRGIVMKVPHLCFFVR